MVKFVENNISKCKSMCCNGFVSLFCLLFILHQPFFLLSQPKTLGIPHIESFNKEDYKAGTSNWSILSMDNGNILVANNSGLLDYNGVNWSLKTLPNRTIARSIALADSDRIYIGGQDEIGYFAPDSIGDLRYVSIRDQIPVEHLPLEDVWECTAAGSRICFRSSNKVFVW